MEAFRISVETDGVLIEWSVRGRPDSFVEVVRRHEVAVHGFLARRAGREAADDLLGEVWLRAFAARGGYDYWRASLQAAMAPAPDVVDPWDEANARLDSAAWAKSLAAAVRALPASEREVLLLVAWEQLTPAEAADVLGIPQGTARSRLHRARTALRLAFGKEDTCPPNTYNLSTRTR